MEYRQIDIISGLAGYVKIGQGRPLVMILRYGATLYNWEQSFIHRLGEEFTLYLIEPPLVGKTSVLIDSDIGGYAAYIRDVLDQLALSKIILLGWSFGGAVAQEFSYLYPGYLSGLVLLSSFADAKLANDEFIELSMGNYELSDKEKARIFKLMFSETQSDLLNLKIRQSGLKIKDYHYRLTASAKELHNSLVSSWNGSPPAKLSQITVPVLVLRSHNDMAFPFTAVSPFIEHLANSKLVMYPRGGHLLIHHHALEAAGDIINFIHHQM